MSIHKALLYAILAIVALGIFYYYVFTYILGLRVTSWWRAPWKNAEVGGKLFSLHQIGLAWDLVPANMATQAQLIATGLPMKVVPESDHIHVQLV